MPALIEIDLTEKDMNELAELKRKAWRRSDLITYLMNLKDDVDAWVEKHFSRMPADIRRGVADHIAQLLVLSGPPVD